LARTFGGERVLVLARLDDLDFPDEGGEAERAGLRNVAYHCDLVPTPDGGGFMRHVVLRAVDVLPGLCNPVTDPAGQTASSVG